MNETLPTPERFQHNEIREFETRKAGKRVRRVTDGTSLDYYLKHGVIDRAQYEAGINLYSLWRAAGWERRITTRFDSLPSATGDGSGSERSAIAYRDLKLIRREMGQALFEFAESVCCHDFMATEYMTKQGRNKRSAPDILRMTLDALRDSFAALSREKARLSKKGRDSYRQGEQQN